MLTTPSTNPFLIAADLLAPTDEDYAEARFICERLINIVEAAWPLVEKKSPYKSNWHIEAVCEYLQAVSDGDIRQLIINIPPRHMKSLAVAVFWPVWEWLVNPETRWLFVSYGATLSKRDSLKCRRIIESKGGRLQGGTLLERIGYQGLLQMLGQTWTLTGDQNEKMRFENTDTGYRLATSVGGQATGEGGDILVIDDPHKADEVESEIERTTAIDFIDGTLSTRHNDPTTGRTVLVMQRLHEQDATGHLLEQGGWEHLCLPAEYEPKHPFVWPNDPRTEPGDLLWPEHFNAEELAKLKLRLGPRAVGQLQQRPSPAEGGILKKTYWRFYDPDLLQDPRQIADFHRVFASWDTALKAKTTSDYSVGQVWGQVGSRRYCIKQVRGRWGLVDLKEQVREMWLWVCTKMPAFAAHDIFVENTANGPDILADLGSEIPGLQPVDVDRDKMARAEAITPQLAAGNVFLPGHRSPDGVGADVNRSGTPMWVFDLIGECAIFPNGANDDMVDTVTQALAPSRFFEERGAAVGKQKGDRVAAHSNGGNGTGDRYAVNGSSFG